MMNHTFGREKSHEARGEGGASIRGSMMKATRRRTRSVCQLAPVKRRRRTQRTLFVADIDVLRSLLHDRSDLVLLRIA